MQFSYTARDNKSGLHKGAIEATDKAAAIRAIKERDLFPVSVKPQQGFTFLLKKKVTLKDKIVFTEQLGIMIKSGLPIVDALKALMEETESKTFARQIFQIISDVEGGEPLSAAMAKHPSTFDEIYVNLIRSGERSGKVDSVLKQLTGQLEKDYGLTRKIKSALAYPVFVISALVIIMIVLLIYVIPQLKTIFDDAGVELPMMTQLIINLSNLFIHYGYIVAIVAGAIAISFMRWRKTNGGRKTIDKYIVKVPVIGTLLVKSYMSRFCRTFSSLAASGLPLLDILKISGDVIGNTIYAQEISEIALKVKSGAALSKSIKSSKLFPGIVGQLTFVGERSGSLEEVFTSLADFFDREVDAIASNLSALLEPLLILIMGIGIGGLIISVLQPIYGLVNAI